MNFSTRANNWEICRCVVFTEQHCIELKCILTYMFKVDHPAPFSRGLIIDLETFPLARKMNIAWRYIRGKGKCFLTHRIVRQGKYENEAICIALHIYRLDSWQALISIRVTKLILVILCSSAILADLVFGSRICKLNLKNYRRKCVQLRCLISLKLPFWRCYRLHSVRFIMT